MIDYKDIAALSADFYRQQLKTPPPTFSAQEAFNVGVFYPGADRSKSEHSSPIVLSEEAFSMALQTPAKYRDLTGGQLVADSRLASEVLKNQSGRLPILWIDIWGGEGCLGLSV